jgi:hypothetical protein
MLCGGWGDRQKGIISTFLIAILTSRVFVIDIDKPCKLDNILLPNIYNWSLCYNFVKTVSKNNLVDYKYTDSSGKLRETIKSLDFNRTWSKQVVTVRVNSYVIDEVRKHKLAAIRLKWLLNITNEKAIHLVLHTLFKPGEKILFVYMRIYMYLYILAYICICFRVYLYISGYICLRIYLHMLKIYLYMLKDIFVYFRKGKRR